MQTVPYLRVFVSSPGDVQDERQIALTALDNTQYHPAFRGKVAFEVIAWDKKEAGTTLRATMSPQEAINLKLPRPSECDIVIVIFHARMGTPFKMDGKNFLSGTHWELMDALDSDRPEVYVFKCTEDPEIKPGDPKRDEKLKQFDTVTEFINSDVFYDPVSRDILRSINFYQTPDEFRVLLEKALAECVYDIVTKDADRLRHTSTTPPPEHEENIIGMQPAIWPDSPFPGLRAFTADDAPIFFGRGRETDALARRVENERFVAVVGASGSGKSSLVAAGLLPRLQDKNASSTRDWLYVRLNPGTDPFQTLADALMKNIPAMRGHPMQAAAIKSSFIADCKQNPGALAAAIDAALIDADEWVEVLIFIDQFEELFTLAQESDRRPFIDLLKHAAGQIEQPDALLPEGEGPGMRATQQARTHIVITMRADFYHQAVPYLEQQLRAGTFTLDKPNQFALLEMIQRPAERAALNFEDGLPEQIVQDTGDEPGALALMAYALDELYEACKDKQHMTFADYEDLGGVQGAIGKRAESVFERLPGTDDDKERLLAAVFNTLISVDERGVATRRRVTFNPDDIDDDVRAMIAAFVQARLLTTDQTGDSATVEVAHEALFRKWPTLVNWISQYKDDLYLLNQMRRAAALWNNRQRSRDFLWHGERGQDMQAMLERLQPELNDAERAFARPEQYHLLDELEDIDTLHARRSEISLRLHELGDPRPGFGVKDGIPDIEWCFVPAGQITVEKQTFDVPDFYIAKYLITYPQFQAFLDAEDGFNNPEWWQDFPEKYRPQNMSTQKQRYSNYPRDSVTWYQSVAFTRWLNYHYQQRNLWPGQALIPGPSPSGRREPLSPEVLERHREMASQAMVGIARELRRSSTPAEQVLWQCLRDRRLANIKFRRQHPVANTKYVVDFFSYDHQLVIEVDGGIHARQGEADAIRQVELEALGLQVLRFTNDAVLNDLEAVLMQMLRQTFPFSLRAIHYP